MFEFNLKSFLTSRFFFETVMCTYSFFLINKKYFQFYLKDNVKNLIILLTLLTKYIFYKNFFFLFMLLKVIQRLYTRIYNRLL